MTRTFSPGRILGVVVLCAVSAALGAYGTRIVLTNEPASSPAPDPAETAAEPPPPEAPFDENWSAERAQLELELAEARAEIERLEAEKLKRLTSNLLTEWRTSARDNASKRSAEEVVKLGERRQGIHGGDFGAGLQEGLFALRDLLLMGDGGVQLLIDMAADPELDDSGLTDIPEYMAYFPSKRALDFLMEEHPRLAYTPAENLDLLMREADSLPTADIRAHIPAMNRMIQQKLSEQNDEGNSASDAVQLIAVLALEHDAAQSWRTLRSSRVWHDAVGDLIRSAEWVGNERAHDLLEQISRTHTNSDAREQARLALENWNAE